MVPTRILRALGPLPSRMVSPTRMPSVTSQDAADDKLIRLHAVARGVPGESLVREGRPVLGSNVGQLAVGRG